MSFVLITLMHIHLVSVAFSIYYHRAAAHQQMVLSKPLEHIFRFILYTAEQGRHHLWLRVVVATHLNHHRHSDTINDYLSPHHHKPLLWYIHSKLAKPLSVPEDFSDQQVCSTYTGAARLDTTKCVYKDSLSRNVASNYDICFGVRLVGVHTRTITYMLAKSHRTPFIRRLHNTCCGI
jgi:fatty-acid desaturase